MTDAMQRFRVVAPEAGMRMLIAGLRDLRARARANWAPLLVPLIRAHPAIPVLRQCPLTGHASTWPRGYPGDPGLLDLIYQQHPLQPTNLPPDVQRITAIVQGGAPCRSIRIRRMLLADAIDAIAGRFPGAHILSLACGHLREAEWSIALAAGAVERLVAADQDEAALRTLAHDYHSRFPAIAPTPLSVRDVLEGHGEALGRFHLVYAAGLCDYLPAPVAQLLALRLFGLLHPGGRLLLGNFGTGMVEIAYMESIMAWPLQWRTPDEIAAFADPIPAGETAARRVWPDPTGSCWYLEIERIC